MPPGRCPPLLLPLGCVTNIMAGLLPLGLDMVAFNDKPSISEKQLRPRGIP